MIPLPDLQKRLALYILDGLDGVGVGDQVESLGIEVARWLSPVVTFGDAGDEFDHLYIDLGGEGGC